MQTTLHEWISSLRDDRLAQLEAAIADERYRRNQEALRRRAEAIPTDEVGQELAAIRANFAEKKDARNQRRLDVRDMLRAGDIPPHFNECGVCGRAVLTLDHASACPTGKLYVGLIG
jgi:hypothetical protein